MVNYQKKTVPFPGPRVSQRENQMFSASRKDGKQKIKGSPENHLSRCDQRSAKDRIWSQTERGRAACICRGPSGLKRNDIRRMINTWNQ